MIGFVFFHVGKNLRKNSSLSYFVPSLIRVFLEHYQSLINSFPAERLLVLHERASGTYNVSAYFCAKNVVEILCQLMVPMFFSIIVYWLIGLQENAAKYVYVGIGLNELSDLSLPAVIRSSLMESAPLLLEHRLIRLG